MSRASKILFLVAFLFVICTYAIYFLTGFWFPINWLLLGLAGACVVGAIGFDYRLYWEFLTMRTTKHGMNMGAMILVVLVGLVCINYLANLHNKSWDLTQEKINSLSDQSVSLVKGLSDDIEIKIFTKGNAEQERKQQLRQTLNLYTDNSSHIKTRFLNPYEDNALAMEYLNDLPDRETGNIFVFVEYKGKKVRADQPFDEAALTSALIKATRQGETKIYFLQGHGEKEITGEGDNSIRDLSKSLGESSFKVEGLNLLDKKAIPDDANVVAIVGPSVQFIDAELQWLREYLKKGGRLFIAVDPGQRTNIANLIKSLGIEFQNNYVVTLTPIVGGGPAMILGRGFDVTSDITRNFPGTSYSLFYLASEVKPAPDKPASIVTHELVKTDKFSFTLDDLKTKLTKRPDTKPITLAVESTGKMDDKDAKDFQAVVFGDSDFLSNRSLMVGVNRDLALNAFAHLANQKDLISIRPKLPKGTMMMLTSAARIGVVFGGLALPLLLLSASAVVWFRRRGA